VTARFTTSQNQIIKEVKSTGSAVVTSKGDYQFVNTAISPVAKGRKLTIMQVKVYGIDQNLNLLHGPITP
jgi:hypothetical protein